MAKIIEFFPSIFRGNPEKGMDQPAHLHCLNSSTFAVDVQADQ